MDNTTRKVLRDFIYWQRKDAMMKDEPAIDYEVIDSYLEDKQRELNDCNAAPSKLVCILDNVEGDGLTEGRVYDVLFEKDGQYCIVDDRGKMEVYGSFFFDEL